MSENSALWKRNDSVTSRLFFNDEREADWDGGLFCINGPKRNLRIEFLLEAGRAISFQRKAYKRSETYFKHSPVFSDVYPRSKENIEKQKEHFVNALWDNSRTSIYFEDGSMGLMMAGELCNLFCDPRIYKNDKSFAKHMRETGKILLHMFATISNKIDPHFREIDAGIVFDAEAHGLDPHDIAVFDEKMAREALRMVANGVLLKGHTLAEVTAAGVMFTGEREFPLGFAMTLDGDIITSSPILKYLDGTYRGDGLPPTTKETSSYQSNAVH